MNSMGLFHDLSSVKYSSLIEKTLKHSVPITTPTVPPNLRNSTNQHSASRMTEKTNRPQSSQNTPYLFHLPFLTHLQDLNHLWYVSRVLKALNKPAVPSHLGPITSAHQGPVFWEKIPRPILFSASFGVSADCQPLWLVFYIHASVLHCIFQFKRWPWRFFWPKEIFSQLGVDWTRFGGSLFIWGILTTLWFARSWGSK